jgi:ABC-type branched-subunit amino acid transport system ATPase component
MAGKPKHPRSTASGKTPSQCGDLRLAALTLTPVRDAGDITERIMMDQKTIPADVQERVTAELHRAFRQLHLLDGISVAEILAVTHAETISQLTSHFGGKVAAECAEMAARRVSHIPRDPVHATATDCVGVMQ